MQVEAKAFSNIGDIEFDPQFNTIDLRGEFGDRLMNLWLDIPGLGPENRARNLILLNRLRYAVDQAIKHNYKIKKEGE